MNIISERLKFSPKQIEALEGGRYEQLPGRAFTRGFVRSYARFLGLPVDEMLGLADKEVPPDSEPPERPILRGAVLPSQRRGWKIPKALLVVLVILLIGGAGVWLVFQWLQSSRFIQPPARENQLLMEDVPPFVPASSAAASAAEASASALAAASGSVAGAASAPAASQSTASGTDALELRFSGLSWVDVRDTQGRSLFKGLGQKGQKISLKGRPPYRIKIGKANVVELRFAGKTVDLKPYTRGEVVNMTLPSAR